MEYRVLGSLEVRDGDGSLPLGGARQRALLALLLLNANQVVSRDRLIDELWGERPPETVVQVLQVYVSRLRKLLPAETLLTRPPGYLLAIAPDELDLQRFERLLAAGRDALARDGPEPASTLLHEALGLWRGPALAEFAFDSFAQEIGRLEDLRLAAVEDRIEADLALGGHADVIGELETLIAENPQRERLRGALMLALYRSGRQAEALDAYRDARASLDELGIEPSEELRRLERSILTQDAALAARAPLVPETPGLPGPFAAQPSSPFVGRERELTELRSLLERAETGAGQVVLLGGEAGSGKSRLARELAKHAVGSGALVLYGGCDPIVTAPYQPFVEALRFLVRIADSGALESCVAGSRAELDRLMGRTSSEVGQDPESARQRLHTAVVDLFANVSRERPLLVVVDDIHWADAPSLHLLRDVARSTPESRLLVLATHRDRSEGMKAEFIDAMAALGRIDGVARVTLSGLSEDEVATYVRASSGMEPADEVAQSIHALTDGTPFLLGELWRALNDANAVEASDGVLRLTRPLAKLSSPQGVREVSEYRLSRLSAATTDLLELAAVIGSQFELGVLREAFSAETLVPSLEEAVSSGTIEEMPGPRLSHRFSHELVRRAVYDRLPSVRRAELHLRVGEALEQGSGTAAELAHHFTRAAPLGDVERAARNNLQAAEAAVALFAFTQAEGFAATALEFMTEGTLAWARAQYLLATARLHLAKPEAEGNAAAAAEAFVAHGEAEAAAEAEMVAAISLRNENRGADSDAASERAFGLVRDRPPSPAKVAALVWWSATLTLTRGRSREAADYAREALGLAEQLGLLRLRVAALNRLGLALHQHGEGGRSELERAVELGRNGVAPYETQAAYNNLAGVLLEGAGRLREAAGVWAAAMAEAERFGLLESLRYHEASLAMTFFNVGDWQRAMALVHRYREQTAELRNHRGAWLVANVAANVALARGEHAAALAEAEKGVARARGYNQTHAIARTLATAARVHVDCDRPAEAEPLVNEFANDRAHLASGSPLASLYRLRVAAPRPR